VSSCPFCGGLLAKNGGYGRRIPEGAGYVDGVILRSYCSRCKVGFSLIPGFILPWHSYSRELVVAWLLERIQGTPYRSKRFLVQQAIAHAPADEDMAWSDMLDFERTRPGYQRFQGWTRRFSRAAQTILGSLLATMAWLDIDLRTAAAKLATLQPVAAPTSPLALALSLEMCLPRGRAPDISGPAGEMGRLVGMLVMRSLPVSHKIRRATSDRIQYDTLVI
jgi:hypothetical protein